MCLAFPPIDHKIGHPETYNDKQRVQPRGYHWLESRSDLLLQNTLGDCPRVQMNCPDNSASKWAMLLNGTRAPMINHPAQKTVGQYIYIFPRHNCNVSSKPQLLVVRHFTLSSYNGFCSHPKGGPLLTDLVKDYNIDRANADSFSHHDHSHLVAWIGRTGNTRLSLSSV